MTVTTAEIQELIREIELYLEFWELVGDTAATPLR
jgi:hypothetical protein